MKEYQSNKRQIFVLAGRSEEESQLTTPVAVLRVGSAGGEWNARPQLPEWQDILGGQRVGSSWHLLERESNALSEALRLNLAELVKSVVVSPTSEPPSLRIVGVANIINQIHSNLWEIPEEILG